MHPAVIIRDLAGVLRRHRFFLVAAPIAILVMTNPTAAIVLDVDTWRAPTHSADVFMGYWDAWYGEKILRGEADLFRSDLLFHPQGLSLAFHNYCLPHMLLLGALWKVLPPVNANALAYLIILAANLLSAYAFLLRKVSRPEFACAGAIMFALSPYLLVRKDQAHLLVLATIPLTLLFLDLAVRRRRWRYSLLAGGLVGFTAFSGLYIFVCLSITLGCYALILAAHHWREAGFWGSLFLLLLVAGIVSLPRLYPMIADQALLAEALDKRKGEEQHTDMLMLFLNTDHPLLHDFRDQLFSGRRLWRYADSALGFLPIALISLCALRSRRRRELLPWLIILLVFVCLRLGSHLTIGGYDLRRIALPKHLLDRLFPPVFEAFWNVSDFQIGILLPWAALFCLSLEWLLGSRGARARAAAVALILVIVCFEYYSETTWHVSTDPQRLAWIDWLDDADEPEALALIHLPMGRNISKQYGFFQTYNGIPHAEGLAARTPAQAYDYIAGNLLLNAWRQHEAALCTLQDKSAWLNAAEYLRADGFTHIIYHWPLLVSDAIFADLAALPAVYSDDYASIFLVEDLPLACDPASP